MLRTLPAACYLSDEVWSAERERIWFTQWVVVARAEDIATVGDRVLADLAGESVIVVRAGDGLRAFYNVCQHRGCELVDRDGPTCGRFGRSIRCPYHAWTYDLDGVLLATPFVDRPDHADGEPITLSGLATAEWGGFVFVCDRPTVGLPAQLGRVAEPVFADIKRAQRELVETLPTTYEYLRLLHGK